MPPASLLLPLGRCAQLLAPEWSATGCRTEPVEPPEVTPGAAGAAVTATIVPT